MQNLYRYKLRPLIRCFINVSDLHPLHVAIINMRLQSDFVWDLNGYSCPIILTRSAQTVVKKTIHRGYFRTVCPKELSVCLNAKLIIRAMQILRGVVTELMISNVLILKEFLRQLFQWWLYMVVEVDCICITLTAENLWLPLTNHTPEIGGD